MRLSHCPKLSSMHVQDIAAFVRTADREVARANRYLQRLQQRQSRLGKAPQYSDYAVVYVQLNRTQWVLQRLERYLHEAEEDPLEYSFDEEEDVYTTELESHDLSQRLSQRLYDI